ncbi:hypothetical protein QVD17_40114 [Tagetes erecta]|uniref:Uncharacterized protein n=1 Tax=Tagetes erecta TaxID=13708 RepID=A0AAD8JTJ6_TARER|nr:hypothetical protein QVD17_40114 [Tagetes erecta]
MKTDHWLQSAVTNDSLVADLLLRLKHSSDSDSLHTPPPPPPATTIVPSRWGHRKNRSKSTNPTTTTTTAVTIGYGKEHRRSPTTHLSWSGGAGSSSDGYEESSRPSDLSSGCRSVKANEVASSISSYNKSQKRKKLASMRMNLSQEIARSENLTRIKVRKTVESEQRVELCSVKAETKGLQKGFVLPDLNMAPDEEDLIYQ